MGPDNSSTPAGVAATACPRLLRPLPGSKSTPTPPGSKPPPVAEVVRRRETSGVREVSTVPAGTHVPHLKSHDFSYGHCDEYRGFHLSAIRASSRSVDSRFLN